MNPNHAKLAREAIKFIEVELAKRLDAWYQLPYDEQETVRDRWYGVVVTAIEDSQEEQ